jgi:hypothetical protein
MHPNHLVLMLGKSCVMDLTIKAVYQFLFSSLLFRQVREHPSSAIAFYSYKLVQTLDSNCTLHRDHVPEGAKSPPHPPLAHHYVTLRDTHVTRSGRSAGVMSIIIPRVRFPLFSFVASVLI